MNELKPVELTDHIRFDESLKTFSLVAGDSLYAFCISPELTLEHLYWGKAVHQGFDLRYLSQSCRMAHFNTIEAAPTGFEGKIVMEADNLEEVQQSWKMNRSVSNDDEGYFQKKRLENYSWRILSKAMLHKSHEDSSRPTRLKSHSVAFDVPPKSEAPAIDLGSKAMETRMRSISNPAASASFSTSSTSSKFNPEALHEFLQLNAMTKFVQSADSPSPGRRFGQIVGQKGQIRHHASKQTFERQMGKLGKGLLCSEYADHGTGDFRSPSFIVNDNFNGSSISPLKYKRHRIYRGKLPMPDSLPGIRSEGPNDASTLVVTMADAGSGLEVDLIYGKSDCDASVQQELIAVVRVANYSGYAQL